MKIACKGGNIDLDELNRFDPDGGGPFCAVMAAGYDGSTGARTGWLETTDGGRIACADLAFKCALDICARAGLKGVRYLINEADRGACVNTEGERALSPHTLDMPDDPFTFVAEQTGTVTPLLPDTSLLVYRNFAALDEYNILKGLLEGGWESLLGFLSKYIWLGGTMSFFRLCASLTALFTASMPDEVRIFLDNAYGLLERHEPEQDAGAAPENQDAPQAKETTEAGALADAVEDASSGTDAWTEPGPDDETESRGGDGPDGTGGSEEVPDGAGVEKDAVPLRPKMPSVTHPIERLADPYSGGVHVKGISAADITGLDETYTMEYCEHVYDRDLSTRDSEGFFESVLKSRLNGTAAPIDLLSETVSKASSGDGQARQLKRVLSTMAENAREALEENA